ncbi:MAG: hypothetical protein LBS72_00225, partial [Oscillospiraceae bacterium]|nr:hypothetical protein [Oscillospiraceae bacterium]
LRVNPPPPVADEGGLERATPRWIKRQCIQTERFFEHALSKNLQSAQLGRLARQLGFGSGQPTAGVTRCVG